MCGECGAKADTRTSQYSVTQRPKAARVKAVVWEEVWPALLRTTRSTGVTQKHVHTLDAQHRYPVRDRNE